jgi:UTP:GlnB (protein PII) uridylyltransferase
MPSTLAAPLAPPRATTVADERQAAFRALFAQRPPTGISPDELEVHFSGMPALYWERVTEADLIWGLETVHEFLRLVASPERPVTAPVLRWHATAEADCLAVMLCTWDRHSLAAKAAAAFSGVGLNISQADLFTRADLIVLDQFTITSGRTAVSADCLDQARQLLEGALSEPPRFTAIWGGGLHNPARRGHTSVKPHVTVDNEATPDSTLVQVQAADRLGLLFQVLQVIADAGLNTRHARAQTRDSLAYDEIYVTDTHGGKLPSARLEWLQARLTAALAAD